LGGAKQPSSWSDRKRRADSRPNASEIPSAGL
jgi:hypothetical protein